MSGPSLRFKGNLRSPTDDPAEQAALNEITPIDYVLDWFAARMSKTGIENRVLIFKSETASGKSTYFPPQLYNRFVRVAPGTPVKPGIICTQPRVLTAIENVNEIVKYPANGMKLGETIGWSTKYNKMRPTQPGLLSATVGTLTAQMKSTPDDEIMRKYRFILIDETHERDLPTDMVVYMLKNFLIRNAGNPACPFVVLMSATFEPDTFLRYFGIGHENFIWCVGVTAHIDERWELKEPLRDYIKYAADKVKEIIEKNPDDKYESADILIFVPGSPEFTKIVPLLAALNADFAKRPRPADKQPLVFSLLQITSDSVKNKTEDYLFAMRVDTKNHIVRIGGKKYRPGRRVVVSTNVAETGLTLSNLRYVIDAGYNKEIEYNPVYGTSGLIVRPAPIPRIRQRRGRVGRKYPGVFYPLYPRDVYDALPTVQYPAILTGNISPIFLDIVAEQVRAKSLSGDREPEFLIGDIDMLDVPAPDALKTTLEKMYSIGFVSPLSARIDKQAQESGDPFVIRKALRDAETIKKYGLTRLGHLARYFSDFAPESARMIMSAYFWGCSVVDMATIAAWLLIDPKSLTATARPDADAAPKKGPPAKVEINWLFVYKKGLPNYIANSNDVLYKTRMLIGDEFIDGLVVLSALKNVLSEGRLVDSLQRLEKWCNSCNLSYNACMTFIKLRDDVIDALLGEGFDVFLNEDKALMAADQGDFTDIVTRIKYCIYDGYRNNLLLRRDDGYYTQQGQLVFKPLLFTDDELSRAEARQYKFIREYLPNVLVCNALELKYNRNKDVYRVVAGYISVMDGFVSVDLDFLQ